MGCSQGRLDGKTLKDLSSPGNGEVAASASQQLPENQTSPTDAHALPYTVASPRTAQAFAAGSGALPPRISVVPLRAAIKAVASAAQSSSSSSSSSSRSAPSNGRASDSAPAEEECKFGSCVVSQLASIRVNDRIFVDATFSLRKCNEGSFLNLTLAQTTGVAPAKGQRQPLAGGRFEHDSDADEDDDPLAGEAISALGAGQPPPTPSKTFFSLPFEHSFSCPCREREMEILSRALTRLEANDAAVGASEPRDGGEEKKPEQMPDAPGLSVVAKHIKAAAVCIVETPSGLLLTRRPLTMRTFPGAWVFPGGKVDRGETFHEAAARELREETGWRVDPRRLEPLCVWESCYPTRLELGATQAHSVVVFMHARLPHVQRFRPEGDRDHVHTHMHMHGAGAAAGAGAGAGALASEEVDTFLLLPLDVARSVVFNTVPPGGYQVALINSKRVDIAGMGVGVGANAGAGGGAEDGEEERGGGDECSELSIRPVPVRELRGPYPNEQGMGLGEAHMFALRVLFDRADLEEQEQQGSGGGGGGAPAAGGGKRRPPARYSAGIAERL